MKIVPKRLLLLTTTLQAAVFAVLVVTSRDLPGGKTGWIIGGFAGLMLLMDMTSKWTARPTAADKTLGLLPKQTQAEDVIGMDGLEITSADLQELRDRAGMDHDMDWDWAQEKQRQTGKACGLLYVDRLRLMRRQMQECKDGTILQRL